MRASHVARQAVGRWIGLEGGKDHALAEQLSQLPLDFLLRPFQLLRQGASVPGEGQQQLGFVWVSKHGEESGYPLRSPEAASLSQFFMSGVHSSSPWEEVLATERIRKLRTSLSSPCKGRTDHRLPSLWANAVCYFARVFPKYCLLALVVALLACSGSEPRPNVLLLIVATLRAEHLGCYGAERPTSPHIDQLAAGGVRFERAYATSP